MADATFLEHQRCSVALCFHIACEYARCAELHHRNDLIGGLADR